MSGSADKPSSNIESLDERGRAPLITVAMPIYNAGIHLRMAVKSILLQTISDWELLIIDDGSTDRALASIDDILDPRIKILSDGRNLGLATRLNEAIDRAQGEFFARMDQDDVSYPDRFAMQLALLRQEPALDLVATRSILIDQNGQAIGQFPFAGYRHAAIAARPWQGFHFPHPTWMGKLSWFRQYRYSQPAPYLCEDQELLLRSYRFSRFGIINEVAFAYRVRDRFNSVIQLNTRKALWGVQVGHFWKNRQPFHILFCTSVYAIRCLADIKRVMAWRLNKESCSPAINPQLTKQWQLVCDNLLRPSHTYTT